MRINVECLAVGLFLGLGLGAGSVYWWYKPPPPRPQPVAKPTIIKIPVVIYKTVKAVDQLPGHIIHDPFIQVLASRRIDRRLATATIDVHTGVGSIYVTPKPFFSFRQRYRVSAYYGMLNGRTDARVAFTDRVARVGPVDVVAHVAADQILQVYAGVGVSYRW